MKFPQIFVAPLFCIGNIAGLNFLRSPNICWRSQMSKITRQVVGAKNPQQVPLVFVFSTHNYLSTLQVSF